MTQLGRRDFLRTGTLGMAAAVPALWLAEKTLATEPSGALGSFAAFAYQAPAPVAKASAGLPIPAAQAPANPKPTEDNILGPFHRRSAPFRGKLTPPLEPGQPLVVRGRVWGADTRKPLTGAVLDVWQANSQGRYDNDDPQSPPAANLFVNRVRLLTDESGYYEYETIKPGRYQIGEGIWRPAHIHYWVAAGGYKSLVTQMYFKGDPYNEKDDFIKASLIVDAAEHRTPHGAILLAMFDIVLAKA